MFMLKYIDFLSRDLSLSFSQVSVGASLSSITSFIEEFCTILVLAHSYISTLST
jgi:hypothetical protein